jgi:hypothetical protein
MMEWGTPSHGIMRKISYHLHSRDRRYWNFCLPEGFVKISARFSLVATFIISKMPFFT